MISFNGSDWLIPITQCYFYIIYIWAYNSGMQIEDLVPFTRIWTRGCTSMAPPLDPPMHLNSIVSVSLGKNRFPLYNKIWRPQKLDREGVPTCDFVAKTNFVARFFENCMKMKEIGPKLDPPMLKILPDE